MYTIYIHAIMTNKNDNKNNTRGGKVIASGGFGCVFNPALKCKGSDKRESGKITKLMTEKHATSEYEEINGIKEKLDTIPNYQDYFLLNNFTICKPSKLSKSDLQEFTKKCSALPKSDIKKKNINEKLDKLMMINMPNGGIPVDDYLYENGSFKKIYLTHISLVELLKKGIVPMNEKNVYHADIKDSNVLADDKSGLKTRLIDWGLSTQYVPFENNPFPKTWRNRPFQFNVPFSVIIFSESFVEKYTKFIKDGGKPNELELKPFVIDYINFWMKERGAGHYKFINEIMFELYSNELRTVSRNNMPAVIETQITMDFIVNYIVNVLVHFTKFRKDGSLNLRDYFDNVFIKIVDIWGFISVYYPVIELLSNNYSLLTPTELKILDKLKFIFVNYLYNPRHEPINMNSLYLDLKDLGNLIYETLKLKNQKKSNTNRSIYSTSRVASGIKNKTKKIRKSLKTDSKTKVSFKRKPRVKRFKKPIF
jgi:hypothetical protein